MAAGPSSQVIEPSPKSGKRPSALSPGWMAFLVGWFLGWPIVGLTCLPLVTPGDELAYWLLGAGSLLWFFSCAGVYGVLLNIAEARWPAAAAILKALGFVFSVFWIFRH